MNGDQIRRVFLDFFEARGHVVVPSASLIPVDPTLLLTNAGMVPFKPYMLGEEPPPYPRAASIQKVARTVDIDIVGTTARHLTFFEMLGNFSLGDYFKEQAIPWAYELATEGLGLDPERLWFTVHHTDTEAEEIWIDGVGVSPDRVQRRDKDNFWQMGIPGPCGPCSEIFYDKGSKYGQDGGPVADEERFVEVWNLVFMQNIQDEPYHVVGDLPAKNIDTGAGLERVATILQGVDTLFETDLVRPIVAAGERLTNTSYGTSERTDISLRILGDHGRAATFLIGDGVVPSNEGRGYVLRRLLRRAVRHAFLLGTRDLVMPTLIEATVEVMREAYPELADKQDAIATMAEREEVRFRKTLESGHQILDARIAGDRFALYNPAIESDQALPYSAKTGVPPSVASTDESPSSPAADDSDTKKFPGDLAFLLHDTYGFPVELTEEILAERGFELDRPEFDRLMQEQRERARAAFKGGKAAVAADVYRSLLTGVDNTEFVGYHLEATKGRILSMLREGQVIDSAADGEQIELFLDRTPFYAESGGQIGDSGIIRTETGVVRIADTRYARPGVHGHHGKVIEGFVQIGQELDAEVDHARRERIRKNHTGTHILHWALREVIGTHVHQAGSLVADDRLRFDFAHHDAVRGEELADIERAVNDRIIANSAVTTIETTKEQAEKMGALMFFGDKYGDDVRVVKAGEYSVEFCGGTHVHTTGQIGPLVLVSEGSVASNTRRVEALTGTAGYGYLSGLRRDLEATAAALGTQTGSVVQTAGELRRKLAEQEERIESFERQERSAQAETFIERAEQYGDAQSLIELAPSGLTADGLRALAYQVRDRLGKGVGVLGTVRDGKGALIAWVSPDLVKEGLSAAELLRPAAGVLGGGGSRDPELAQAGGPHGDRIEDAIEQARSTVQSALQAR